MTDKKTIPDRIQMEIAAEVSEVRIRRIMPDIVIGSIGDQLSNSIGDQLIKEGYHVSQTRPAPRRRPDTSQDGDD